MALRGAAPREAAAPTTVVNEHTPKATGRAAKGCEALQRDSDAAGGSASGAAGACRHPRYRPHRHCHPPENVQPPRSNSGEALRWTKHARGRCSLSKAFRAAARRAAAAALRRHRDDACAVNLQPRNGAARSARARCAPAAWHCVQGVAQRLHPAHGTTRA